MLTAKYVGLALLALRLLQIAYLIPGSFGGNETSLGGIDIALIILTMLNFMAAIAVTMLGLSRQVDRSSLFDRLAELNRRVFTLLGVGWKVLLAVVGAAGAAAMVYGVVNWPPAVYDNGGRFYHRVDGKLLEISAGQYVSAVHPALLFTAGVLTILQVAAFCLTLVAVDLYGHRPQGGAGFAARE